MSRKNNFTMKVNPLRVRDHEQSTLTILFAIHNAAQAQAAIASNSLREYLQRILKSRGLDEKKWGVTEDLTQFAPILQPAPAAPAETAPAPPEAPAETAPALAPPDAPQE